MSERDLRDELEQLHGELAALERALAVPDSEQLAQERSALLAERDAERAAVSDLERQLDEARARIAQREQELPALESSLREARAEIARLEPLGDPLAESRANWESATPRAPAGCAFGLWGVVAAGAALAVEWWR